MDVIILAGGFGTRLKEVVSDVPKPMAPIGDKPFLEYVLRWLAQYPVKRIVLSVGYKSEIIQKYFGNNFRNIPIIYVKESTPLGTGGAVLYALRQITVDNVLIVNGDTYFPINLNDFNGFHLQNESKMSIALKMMKNFNRYGSVELLGQNIVRFNEKKTCGEGLINGGIYLLKKSFIEEKNLPVRFSFEKEILEKETGNNNIKGLVFKEQFIDIGIPSDYRKADETLANLI